jgi:hypothetical protein
MGSMPSRLRAQDANGVPLSGAKLHTYIVGTTTNKATYSNVGLTAANANPVLSDSAGWFGEIYCLKDQNYKFVLKDASDVTIWTIDDVPAVALITDDLATRISQIASNPLDEGAVGDGVADEAAEVQAAIDGATGVVDLLGKIFRCDSAITLRSGITLRNGTLDFTNSTATQHIAINGSKGTPTNLTANGDYGDTAVVLTSASGMAAGNLLSIDSSAVFQHASGVVRGEIAEISLIAGLTATLSNPLRDDYTTASTAKAAKLTTVDNVILENLTIIGNSAQVATAVMVSARTTKGLRIRDCRIRGIPHIGINIDGCYDTVVERCHFDDGDPLSSAISFNNATTKAVVRDCTARRVTQMFNGNMTSGTSSVPNGPRRDILIDRCVYNSVMANGVLFAALADGVAGCEAQGLEIARCLSITASTGNPALIKVDAIDSKIHDNTLIDTGATTSIGISFDTSIVPSRAGRLAYVSIHNNHIRLPSGCTAVFPAGGEAASTYVFDVLHNYTDIGTATNFSGANVRTGYIPLDLFTARIISADAIQATTEGGVPDSNTAPSIARINGATDKQGRMTWAAASVAEIQFAPVAYPPDLDDTEPVTINFLAMMSGSTDTPTLTVAYFEGIGDTNAGGATGALSASLAKVNRSIAAADVGAYPKVASISVLPGAHGTDAVWMHAAWIEYQRKM